jgi:hypothetical protein
VTAKAQVDLDYIATGVGRPSVPWTEHAPLLRAPTLVLTGDRDVLVGAEGPSGGPEPALLLTGLRSFRVLCPNRRELPKLLSPVGTSARQRRTSMTTSSSVASYQE